MQEIVEILLQFPGLVSYVSCLLKLLEYLLAHYFVVVQDSLNFFSLESVLPAEQIPLFFVVKLQVERVLFGRILVFQHRVDWFR